MGARSQGARGVSSRAATHGLPGGVGCAVCRGAVPLRPGEVAVGLGVGTTGAGVAAGAGWAEGAADATGRAGVADRAGGATSRAAEEVADACGVGVGVMAG